MTRLRRAVVGLMLAATGVILLGCGRDADGAVRLRLASTTSFRDTGFADVLLPAFTAETGIAVDILALGTGEALKLAERGDADVVLVHARAAEDAFLAKGFGVERRDVFWNRFLILGPAADPAGARGSASAKEALERITAASALFLSRGDDSGTHKRELALWGAMKRTSAYQETGQGQGPTLVIASEKQGYLLSDEGTWLSMKARLALVPLVAGDPALDNPYGAITVRASARGAARFAAAKRLVDWLTGPKARDLVRTFTVGGRRAFYLPGEARPAGD